MSKLSTLPVCFRVIVSISLLFVMRQSWAAPRELTWADRNIPNSFDKVRKRVLAVGKIYPAAPLVMADSIQNINKFSFRTYTYQYLPMVLNKYCSNIYNPKVIKPSFEGSGLFRIISGRGSRIRKNNGTEAVPSRSLEDFLREDGEYQYLPDRMHADIQSMTRDCSSPMAYEALVSYWYLTSFKVEGFLSRIGRLVILQHRALQEKVIFGEKDTANSERAIESNLDQSQFSKAVRLDTLLFIQKVFGSSRAILQAAEQHFEDKLNIRETLENDRYSSVGELVQEYAALVQGEVSNASTIEVEQRDNSAEEVESQQTRNREIGRLRAEKVQKEADLTAKSKAAEAAYAASKSVGDSFLWISN